MEHLLPEMEPPKRTNEEKEKSLRFIKQRVNQRTKNEKKKNWLKLASSYVGVAAISFLLFAANLLPPSTVTSSDKEVKYVSFIVNEMKPRYYINGGGSMLNKEGIKNITELAALADQGVPYDIENYFEYVAIANHYYLSETMLDTETYTLLIPKDKTEEYYFLNNAKNTGTALSHEQYLAIQSSIETYSEDYNTLPTIVRILLVSIIYSIYLFISMRIHPHIRNADFDRMNTLNTIGKIAISIVTLYVFAFLLSPLSDGYINIITAFFIISVVIFVRTFIENYFDFKKRNWLEVPLTIFVYTLNLFILFYN